MIIGIETIDKKMRSAILSFIVDNLDTNENIKIEEEDCNIISINNNRYFCITRTEQDELIEDYNDEHFAYYFEGLTPKQLEYINKEQWLDDNGLEDFKEYLKDELDELPSDPLYYGGYYIYEL